MAREASTHIRVSRETRDSLQLMLETSHQQCDTLEGLILWLVEHENGQTPVVSELKPLLPIKGSTLPGLRTTAPPRQRTAVPNTLVEREVTPMFKKGKKE